MDAKDDVRPRFRFALMVWGLTSSSSPLISTDERARSTAFPFPLPLEDEAEGRVGEPCEEATDDVIDAARARCRCGADNRREMINRVLLSLPASETGGDAKDASLRAGLPVSDAALVFDRVCCDGLASSTTCDSAFTLRLIARWEGAGEPLLPVSEFETDAEPRMSSTLMDSSEEGVAAREPY